MLMVEKCTALGYTFPITWTLESATAAWNPRALKKLFADIVLVNNFSGGQDWLVTADNHPDGSLYAATKMVIDKFKKPVPGAEQQTAQSI